MARGDFLKKQLSGMTFMLDTQTANELVAWANDGAPENVVKIAHDSVTYSEVNNVAVIAIDGATHKKDVGGLCMSVASYDQVYQYVDKAEANDEIDTILFRVDSPGGAADGADELGEKIYNASKKTVTFYENRGQSAAIYYGTASDEVYASKTAKVGSIGVITIFEKPDDHNLMVMTSKRAENKVCDLNDEECVGRIQKDIDRLESFFYERIHRNIGLTEEAIERDFGKGGSLYAEDAKSIGFLDGITTFDTLLKHLTKGEKMEKEKKEQTKQPEFSAESVAAQIKENLSVVPKSMLGNEAVMAKATDPLVTQVEMKAFLWDMKEELKKEQLKEEKEPNKMMQEIDGTSTQKDYKSEVDDDEVEIPEEAHAALKGDM